MSPMVAFILLFSLGLGTTITFASSHWLLAWMGLELNTLAIIPLMARLHHPRATEASTKYFLVQAIAAAALLFASTSNAWLTGQWNIYEMAHPLPTTLTIIALSLKIGLAPLHLWLPEVLQGLDLFMGLILTTWQKLAPLILLLQIPQASMDLLLPFGLLSIIVGGWGGMNQTQLRKLLAYSSIAHLGWMVLILKFLPSLTALTLLLYILMTSPLFLTLMVNKTMNINSLALSWTNSPTMTALTSLILLALGGLPPLTGFMPKWLILQELTKQDFILLATLAALASLLSLFFYLRLTFAMSLTTSPSNFLFITPWRRPQMKHSLILTLTILASLMLLPLTPTFNLMFSNLANFT